MTGNHDLRFERRNLVDRVHPIFLLCCWHRREHKMRAAEERIAAHNRLERRYPDKRIVARAIALQRTINLQRLAFESQRTTIQRIRDDWIRRNIVSVLRLPGLYLPLPAGLDDFPPSRQRAQL